MVVVDPRHEEGMPSALGVDEQRAAGFFATGQVEEIRFLAEDVVDVVVAGNRRAPAEQDQAVGQSAGQGLAQRAVMIPISSAHVAYYTIGSSIVKTVLPGAESTV